MDTFWQDVRFGVRMLKKSPGVTALAIVALALGMGVNTLLLLAVAFVACWFPARKATQADPINALRCE
jgi:ABC-type lipoprotein release transport system permease subunit